MQKLLKCRAETLLCVHEWIEQDNNPRSVLVPTHQELKNTYSQTFWTANMTIKKTPTKDRTPSPRRITYCAPTSRVLQGVTYALPGQSPSTNSSCSSNAVHGHPPSAIKRDSNTLCQQNPSNALTRTCQVVLEQNKRPSSQVTSLGVSASRLPRGRTVILPDGIQSSPTRHLQNTAVRTCEIITQNPTPTTVPRRVQPTRGLSFGLPGSSYSNTRRTSSGVSSSPVSSRVRSRHQTSRTKSKKK